MRNKKLSANSQEKKLTGILFLESNPVNQPICVVEKDTTDEILDEIKYPISKINDPNKKQIFKLYVE